jgi:hypothetical protein
LSQSDRFSHTSEHISPNSPLKPGKLPRNQTASMQQVLWEEKETVDISGRILDIQDCHSPSEESTRFFTIDVIELFNMDMLLQ